MKAWLYINGQWCVDMINVTFHFGDKLPACWMPECDTNICTDTEDWEHPVCDDHHRVFGETDQEPDWSTLFPGVVLHPPAQRVD